MPARGNPMTQKKKAPSEFDSAFESYVLDQMGQRGGVILTSKDLSGFVKKTSRSRVQPKRSIAE